jgi:hypothetical protein
VQPVNTSADHGRRALHAALHSGAQDLNPISVFQDRSIRSVLRRAMPRRRGLVISRKDARAVNQLDLAPDELLWRCASSPTAAFAFAPGLAAPFPATTSVLPRQPDAAPGWTSTCRLAAAIDVAVFPGDVSTTRKAWCRDSRRWPTRWPTRAVEMTSCEDFVGGEVLKGRPSSGSIRQIRRLAWAGGR